MTANLPPLIFDTSGLNWLADDEDCDSIVKALKHCHFVRLIDTSVSEVMATKEEVKRQHRFDLLARLVHQGGALRPLNWILEEHVRAYHGNPVDYNWTRIEIRFPDLDRLIAIGTPLHGASQQTGALMEKLEERWIKSAKESRDDFLRRAGLNPRDPVPPIQTIAPRLLAREGDIFEIATEYIAARIGTNVDPEVVEDILQRCPPLAVYFNMKAIAFYDRIVRHQPMPSHLGKVGMADTLSSVYLPYCKRFVTSDKDQGKALRFIRDWMKLKTEVLDFAEFKKVIGF
jgi:hypothetical protein